MKSESAIGKQAPDFTFNDLNGQVIKLSEFRSKKHVVLAFLRGFT
jgi:peroxiredoxin